MVPPTRLTGSIKEECNDKEILRAYRHLSFSHRGAPAVLGARGLRSGSSNANASAQGSGSGHAGSSQSPGTSGYAGSGQGPGTSSHAGSKSAGGHAYSFDRLLIATGSKCFIPPFKGADLAGVFTLHSIGDARRIKERARNCRSAVIIGCGVLGLELAAALTKFGIQVSLIESAPRMLPRQLDNAGANVLKNLLEEKHGLAFYLDSQVQEIAGAGRAEGVVLAGGGCVQGDIVVISAGVRPNVGLAERMGLKVNKGIIVDDRMETSQQDVFAAGDVAQHRGIVYGIVPAAQRQGEVAGANMAGGSESYEGTTISNFVNVLGTSLVSAGEIDAAGNRPSLVRMDEVKNSYRKLVFENGMITGSILLNDVRGSAEILQAIQKKINVGPLRESLLDDNFDYQRLVHAQI